MRSRNEQSRPQQINRKSHNGKPEKRERERQRDIVRAAPDSHSKLND